MIWVPVRVTDNSCRISVQLRSTRSFADSSRVACNGTSIRICTGRAGIGGGITVIGQRRYPRYESRASACRA